MRRRMDGWHGGDREENAMDIGAAILLGGGVTGLSGLLAYHAIKAKREATNMIRRAAERGWTFAQGTAPDILDQHTVALLQEARERRQPMRAVVLLRTAARTEVRVPNTIKRFQDIEWLVRLAASCANAPAMAVVTRMFQPPSE